MIEITEERYNELLDAFIFLNALEEAGVDNWSGYGDAWEIYDEMKEETE